MRAETIRHAIAVVASILKYHNLFFDKATVLHSSNNLILHLDPLPIVAKVHTFSNLSTVRNNELCISQHLDAIDVPCVSPSTYLPPVVHSKEGFVVTFWSYFEGSVVDEPDKATALGLIKNLHRGLSTLPKDMLPRFDSKIDDCLGNLDNPAFEMPSLDICNRSFLSRVLKTLKTKMNDTSLEHTVIHGDCRPANLLWSKNGEARWLDFEAVCIGPRVWDYVMFFGPDDALLEAQRETVELLDDIASACVSTWCWQKQNREPADQEAADYHLEKLREKYY